MSIRPTSRNIEEWPAQAVIFDLNGVLTRPPSPVSAGRLRALAELDEETFEHLYWRHRPAYDRADLDAAEYWRLVGAAGGRTYSNEQIETLVRADAETWATPNPPMVQALRALGAAGVPTAILSNTPADVWHYLARRHDWIQAATVTALSFELHMVKPEPAPYLRCLDQLAVKPGDVVYVDDRIENVEAAQRLGIRGWHYVGADRHRIELALARVRPAQ